MSDNLKKTLHFLSTLAAVITPFVIIGGAYAFYMSNVYRPKVTVSSVDWANGTAQLTINGEDRTLYAGSTQYAKGSWGVRFALRSDIPVRIEVVQHNLVYQVLAVK